VLLLLYVVHHAVAAGKRVLELLRHHGKPFAFVPYGVEERLGRGEA
jgi:hypothetical protein